MWGDCDKIGATGSRHEAHLNCAVHRELRRLVSAEGEGARRGWSGERDNRYVDQCAIVAEDGREMNEAYGTN
jgi:hypothetical protein